nr:uncharacterized protein LOC125632977 isoform X3 [Caretta caretta]
MQRARSPLSLPPATADRAGEVPESAAIGEPGAAGAQRAAGSGRIDMESRSQMERGDKLHVGDRREMRERGMPDTCGAGSADISPKVFIKTEQEEEPCAGAPPEQGERGIRQAPSTGWPDVKQEIVVKVEPDDESYVGYPQGLGDRDLPGYPSTGIKAEIIVKTEPEDDSYGECGQHYCEGDGPDDPFCDANPELIVKVEPDDESAIGYPQGLSEGGIPGYPSPDRNKKPLAAVAAQEDLARASTKKSNLPPMIDSRFTEKDLNNVFTFEFENPKSGLLRKAKKKSATCKVEKEVNGELKPCSFKTSEASAVKSFSFWRHVKRNHPENYAALVTKKDQEDEAKQKADAAKQRSSGSLKTPGEKIFCGASSEKKPKIEQTKLDSYLKSSKVTVIMDANTFHEGLMEMVCLSSTPLTTFRLKNKGFQKITGEMGWQLGVLTGHDAVRRLVVSTAESGRKELKKALEQKLCYLKIDAATHGNRHFLAISAQYYEEGKDKAVVKTLDIIDTEGHHNSSYVKSQVKAILEKLGISEMQVLSICVDKAANMMCAVKNFSEDNETISTSETRDVDRTEAILPDEGTKGMSEIELNMDAAAQWVNDPSLILPTWLHEDDSKVQLMRCGIHTLQLAIWGGLNKQHAKKFLAKIRQVVVKL